jgi:hypothetical protein
MRAAIRCCGLRVLSMAGLMLGGASAAVASTENARAGISAGRYSEPLVRCQLSSTFRDQRQGYSCGVLRLEQNLEGLLSVRFSLSDSAGRYGHQDFVFAGMLNPRSSPMACRDDGRCTPRFPVQLSVNAMASGRFDRRGLAARLPQTWLVRGECRIEARRASCQAVDRQGVVWRAEGFFRDGQAVDKRGAYVDNHQPSARVSAD